MRSIFWPRIITVLRALAENKVRWAFWPPGTDEQVIEADQESGAGIWLPHSVNDETSDDNLSESEDDHAEANISDHEDEDEFDDIGQGSDLDEEAGSVGFTTGRFTALSIAVEGTSESGSSEYTED